MGPKGVCGNSKYLLQTCALALNGNNRGGGLTWTCQRTSPGRIKHTVAGSIR